MRQRDARRHDAAAARFLHGFLPLTATLGLHCAQENGGKPHGETHQPRHRAARSGPGDLLRRPPHRPRADLRAGREDAQTWADYINVGMEHGAFDMAGLAEYMRGLVDGGPTKTGHRTPAVIVEAPVNGIDEANVGFNAWQFRQILGAACTASCSARRRSADAVRAFVESAATRITGRWRRQARRRHAAAAARSPRPRRSGASTAEYLSAATPGRSTRRASCCSASRSKAQRASSNARRSARCLDWDPPSWDPATWACRSATTACRASPTRRKWRRARARVFSACKWNKLAFLEGAPGREDRGQPR